MNKSLPSVEEFYLNASLYDKFIISEMDKSEIFNLIFFDKTIDCFCQKCEQISVFKAENNKPTKQTSNLGSTTITSVSDWNYNLSKDDFKTQKVFQCVRNINHKLSYNILISDQNLQKIGQYPSIADLSSYSIKKFSKILGKELYSEFNRGIGLYSHGVGVGSFVYLRRIIENFIILPAYQEANKTPNWDDEEYQKLRVTEKIKKLKNFLPELLVQNSVLYSIVSKGIHELSEEECLEYSPVLRELMEYILTDLQAKKETEKKKQELAKKIGEISNRLKE